MVKNIFFCRIKRRSSNITSVSKQKYSFTILKTISKLGILAVTCYPDLGVWLTLLTYAGDWTIYGVAGILFTNLPMYAGDWTTYGQVGLLSTFYKKCSPPAILFKIKFTLPQLFWYFYLKSKALHFYKLFSDFLEMLCHGPRYWKKFRPQRENIRTFKEMLWFLK